MGPLADERWRLIGEDVRSGPMQMALDEVAARTAVDAGLRTVRVYTWTPGALSLGYRQDAGTVDWAACETAGIDVTRRQTGGGGIYHDPQGDVSYSVVAPADELPGDLMECYELLCRPVLAALRELGLDAGFADRERPAVHQPACYLRAIDPAHDVVADGRKVSGNAQYRRRDAVIQHGSISVSVQPERHLRPFATDDVGPATFRDRVAGVADLAAVDRSEVVGALEASLAEWTDAEPGDWSDDELAAARERCERKYDAEAWVRAGEAPPPA